MYMSIKYYKTVLQFWVGNGAVAVPTEYNISTYIYINSDIILNSHYQPNTLPVNKTIVHYISKNNNITRVCMGPLNQRTHSAVGAMSIF